MGEVGIIETRRHPVKLRAVHPGTVTLPIGRTLFGLFGLSRLFGFWLNETNQMNQINQINQTDRAR
jgi:hypothetical protein